MQHDDTSATQVCTVILSSFGLVPGFTDPGSWLGAAWKRFLMLIQFRVCFICGYSKASLLNIIFYVNLISRRNIMTITDKSHEGEKLCQKPDYLVIMNTLRLTTNYLRPDWEVFRSVKHKINTNLRATVEGNGWYLMVRQQRSDLITRI